jgi:hypothetical protein
MTDIIEPVMPVIEMPVMPPPSAEQIAQNYKAMGDSVDLINQYVAGNFPEMMKPEEVDDAIGRNVGHLELMVSKDYWTNEDLSAAKAAIAAGKK